MTQELLSGLNGYNIPCRHTIQGGESMVCLITHGFGSSKDSPTAQLLAGELPRHGIGTLALDLPAHGDSPVDGDALSIRHCLDDLARAEARALELAPGARVVYFSSSFGAYLKLTPAFLADLDAHDLFQLYRSGEERVCMIHGDEDQTASPEAARRFAQTFGARLIQVPGGDHSLSGPGMPQLVVREALEFYLAP